MGEAVYVLMIDGKLTAVTKTYDAAQEIVGEMSFHTSVQIIPMKVCENFEEWSERVFSA